MRCGRGRIGWQKLRPKNRKRQFDFFGCDFRHPIPPSPKQSSQDPRIRDIESSSNIFGNILITITGSSKMQYREFEGLAIMMGWRRRGTKIAEKKLKTSAGCWKKRLKYRWDKLLVLVIRHLVIWPSHSTKLVGQLVVWTCLNELFITWNKKNEKQVVPSLPPAPKKNTQNLNYFKTYASELPFSHSVPVPSQSLCRDLHPLFSYCTQKLSVQFLLKATVRCHFLVHLSVTILSTLVLCIHSLFLKF